MMCIRIVALCLAAATVTSPQSKKDIFELQRDVALTQDEVRKMRAAMDEKFNALTGSLQQALDSINRNQASLAQFETAVRERLAAQEKSLVAPLAAAGAKVDRLTEEMGNLRSTVSELGAMMRKQQLQLTDISSAIRTLQAPPTPPPSAAPNAAGGPPPGLSAETLYSGALRDKTGGNLELAMQQFRDYLKYFPNTEYAPNAQFYIGEIYYNGKEYDAALKAFEAVLQYPDNNKSADALYMKGMTLKAAGDRLEALRSFREVTKRYPTADVAAKAKRELAGGSKKRP